MGGGKRYSEKKKKITGSNGEGDGDQKKKKKYRSPHEMPPRISNDNSKYIKKKKHHRDAALCASI